MIFFFYGIFSDIFAGNNNLMVILVQYCLDRNLYLNKKLGETMTPLTKISINYSQKIIEFKPRLILQQENHKCNFFSEWYCN